MSKYDFLSPKDQIKIISTDPLLNNAIAFVNSTSTDHIFITTTADEITFALPKSGVNTRGITDILIKDMYGKYVTEKQASEISPLGSPVVAPPLPILAEPVPAAPPLPIVVVSPIVLIKQIDIGTIIAITSSNDKYNTQIGCIIDNNDEAINLFIIQLGESITINYSNWDGNEYNITNITEHTEMIEHMDTPETESPQEIADFIEEKVYSLNEQQESIYSDMVQKIPYTNHYILSKLSKNINTMINLINENQYQENNIVQERVRDIGEHPFKHAIINHQYNDFIQPVVFDQKKRFTDMIINDDDELAPEEYISKSKEYSTNDLFELKIYSELYTKYTNKYISFNELYKLLYNGGTLEEPITINGLLIDEIKPILRPFLNNSTGCLFENYTMKYPLQENTLVYRSCLPFQPCSGYNPDTSIQSESRIADGSMHRYYDNPNTIVIGQGLGKGISVCHGSADKHENIYFNPNDKYVPDGKEFNLSISKLPDKHVYIEGEYLNIVGLFLNFKELGIKSWQTRYSNEITTIDGDSYHIDNTLLKKGITLTDLINKKTISKPSHISIICNKQDYTNNDNHMYLFNRNSSAPIDTTEYIEKCINILPTISDIIHLESVQLTNIVSISDLDKILSKYNVTIDTIHIDDKHVLLDIFKNMEEAVTENIHFTDHIYNQSMYIQSCFKNIDYKMIEYFNHMSRENIENNLYYENLLSYAKVNYYNDSIFRLYITNHLRREIEDPDIKLEHAIHYCITYIRESVHLYNSPLVLLHHNEIDYDILHQLFNVDKMYKDFVLGNNDNLFEIYGRYVRSSMNNTHHELYNNLFKLHNIEKEFNQTTDQTELIRTLKHKFVSILRQVKREKKQNSIYLKRCKGFHIKKIYYSKSDLLHDNTKEIQVDHNFDNIDLYKKVLAEYEEKVGQIDNISPHIHKIIKLFHVYSPTELNINIEHGIKSLLDNRDLIQFLVKDGDYALYVRDQQSKLYKRVKKIWSPMDSSDIIKDSELCNQEALSLVNIDMNTLLNDDKCITYRGECLPKIVVRWLDQINTLKSRIKLYQSSHVYREKLILEKQICIANINKYISDFQLIHVVPLTKKEVKVVDKRKEQLDSRLQTILKMNDIDQRFDALSKLIHKYGILDKKKTSYVFIEETDLDENNYIYNASNEDIDYEAFELVGLNDDTKNTIVIVGSGSYQNNVDLVRYAMHLESEQKLSDIPLIYFDLRIKKQSIVIRSKQDGQWINEVNIDIPELTPDFLTNTYEIRLVLTNNIITVYLNSILVTNYKLPIHIPSENIILTIPHDNASKTLKIWTGKTINKEIFNINHKFDDWIYWNVEDQKYKMCCKHYIDLVKIAWLSNEDRDIIFKKLETDWSGIETDGNIYCKNCSEMISISKGSIVEGFSDNKPINFRDIWEETELVDIFNFTGIDLEIFKILQGILNNLDIDIIKKDIYEIVNIVSSVMLPNIQSFSEFERHIHVSATPPIQTKTFQKLWYNMEKYKKGRMEYLNEGFDHIDVVEVQNYLIKNKIDKKSDIYYFLNNCIDILHSYYDKKYYKENILLYTISCLIIIVITAIPSYAISNPGSEKLLNIHYTGNVLSNIDNFSHYISTIVYNIVKGCSSKSIWKPLQDYIRSKGKGKRSAIEISIDKIKDKINEKFIEYQTYPIIQSKFSKKDTIIDIVPEEEELIQWDEFRPPLQSSLEKKDLNVVDLSSNLVKYFEIRHQLNLGERTKVQEYHALMLEIKAQWNHLTNQIINNINYRITTETSEFSLCACINYLNNVTPTIPTYQFMNYFLDEPDMKAAFQFIYDNEMEFDNIGVENRIYTPYKTLTHTHLSDMVYNLDDEDLLHYYKSNILKINKEYYFSEDAVSKRIYMSYMDVDKHHFDTIQDTYSSIEESIEQLRIYLIAKGVSGNELLYKIKILTELDGIITKDIVSNEYDFIIQNKVNLQTDDQGVVELKHIYEELLENKNRLNTLYLSSDAIHSMDTSVDYITQFKTHFIESITTISESFNGNGLSDYISELNTLRDDVNGLYERQPLSIKQLETSLDTIISPLYQSYKQNMSDFFDFFTNDYASLAEYRSFFMDHLGSYNNRFTEILNQIDNQLIIEGYLDHELFQLEKAHRIQQITIEQNITETNKLKHYLKQLLQVSVQLKNKKGKLEESNPKSYYNMGVRSFNKDNNAALKNIKMLTNYNYEYVYLEDPARLKLDYSIDHIPGIQSELSKIYGIDHVEHRLSISSFISSKYLKYIYLYLISVQLKYLITGIEESATIKCIGNYLHHEFIIPVIHSDRLENNSNQNLEDSIQIKFAEENNRRKQVFKKMSADENELDSLQKLQRLYREFGLGKQFNPTKIKLGTEEDVYYGTEEQVPMNADDQIDAQETEMAIGEDDEEFVS